MFFYSTLLIPIGNLTWEIGTLPNITAHEQHLHSLPLACQSRPHGIERSLIFKTTCMGFSYKDHSVQYLSVCLSEKDEINVPMALSVFRDGSVCLFICLSIYMSVYLTIYIYMCLSIYLSTHAYVCLSALPSIHPSIHPSVRLSIYLSMYLPTYLPIYMSV